MREISWDDSEKAPSVLTAVSPRGGKVAFVTRNSSHNAPVGPVGLGESEGRQSKAERQQGYWGTVEALSSVNR